MSWSDDGSDDEFEFGALPTFSDEEDEAVAPPKPAAAKPKPEPAKPKKVKGKKVLRKT